MANLRGHLAETGAAVGIPAAGKEDAIRRLVGLLGNDAAIADADALVEAVLEREFLSPTGVGEGCALPHAHSNAVAELRIAVATLATGVDFGGPDGKPARLVVLMVGPESSAGLHLKLLAKLARLLHDPSFRAKALAAPDGKALANLFLSRDT
ncbi:MAG: PTS sugar transporter subunit IIA [Spirochaetales bacterium]|nr:PTS sugar transporter subunit IIA [Spirochaetales bacterium]